MTQKAEADWSEDEQKLAKDYEKKVRELQEEREKFRKVKFYNYLGPVVQSVSVMSSLRVISLTVLVDSIHNILIFFAEKNVSKKLLTFIQQKISAYLHTT